MRPAKAGFALLRYRSAMTNLNTMKDADPLVKATYSIAEAQLEWMVLEQGQLPPSLRYLEEDREEVLDNETMAEAGPVGRTALSMEETGRITGFVRDFGSDDPTSGAVLAAATVVHLFEGHAAVSRWIDDVFVKEMLEKHGPDGEGHFLTTQQVPVEGFHDHAAAVHTTQEAGIGTISSTIVDFRIGRLLGVAYVVTPGESVHLDMAQELALTLERHMVSVILGG
jgi:hypothetical protein